MAGEFVSDRRKVTEIRTEGANSGPKRVVAAGAQMGESDTEESGAEG